MRLSLITFGYVSNERLAVQRIVKWVEKKSDPAIDTKTWAYQIKAKLDIRIPIARGAPEKQLLEINGDVLSPLLISYSSTTAR